MNQNLRKIVYIGAAILALALIVFIFILGLQSKDKTATITIQSVVPNDPTITIDGQKVKANGDTAVTPGKHTLVAKRNGFADKTQEVEAKNGQPATVRLIMTPNSQVGYDWLREHPDQAVEWEGQVGQQFDQNSRNTTNRNPLISYLPEIRPTWRVDYGKSEKHPDDPSAVQIIITYGGADIDKQNALQWIKDQGFNPNDYEIKFQLPPQPGG
jgi:hypothetical protein